MKSETRGILRRKRVDLIMDRLESWHKNRQGGTGYQAAAGDRAWMK
jgi:hypothetical protein